MPSITVYSTPTCVFCHTVKEYLKSKKIAYKAVDLTTIPNGAQLLYEKSGQLGVPVIDINGEIIVGFDRNRIDVALRDNNLM